MASQEKHDKKPAHRNPFVWLICIEILILLLVPVQVVTNSIVEEDVVTTKWMGKESRLWIRTNAEEWHRETFYDTGLLPTLKVIALPHPDEEDNEITDVANKFVFPYVESRIQIIGYVSYLATYRIAGMIIWWPLLLTFLAPVILDAKFLRNIRQYSFAYASPFWQKAGSSIVRWVLLTIPFILVFPLPIPPVSAPIATFIIGVTMWKVIINLPKRM